LTEHYVTLFDSVFLPQGLALHHSLLEHGGDCVLWVLCLDHACLQTLQRLDLPQMRLLVLTKLETPELLAVKPGRTRAEYCWTLTPWSIQWVLEAEPTAQRVTYLDADVFFLKSPAPIFTEFEASGCGVLITEHGYAPEYDQTPTSGRYCVQFLPVVRGFGETILHWWRDRCLEWCFARFENGLFGDQKYVEQFSSIAPTAVHPIGPDCRFQAPWNCSVFKFSDAIIFHFHGLRILSCQLVLASGGNYLLPRPTISCVYQVYCDLLVRLIGLFSLEILPQATIPSSRMLMRLRWSRSLRRRFSLPIHPPNWYQQPPGNTSGYFW
jgi:hypothetical protein